MGWGRWWVCAHACSNPQRLEEGIGYPGARVIGGFEISGVAGKDLNSGPLQAHPGWCWRGRCRRILLADKPQPVRLVPGQ